MDLTVEAVDTQREVADPLGEGSKPGVVRFPRSQLRWYAILLFVWVAGSIYVQSHLMRGWVPHDEGAFAQSADRVLHGEMPHRDYTEIYTGGLAYLHALAFRIFGEQLPALRIVLFGFFLIWVPVFYWIASRITSDWAAGCATLLAIAWTIPNYSAAVPSWYNLFFATFGLAALVLYLDTDSTGWLFLAGAAGGLSFLAKNMALLYIGGALLFFLFHEQGMTASKDGGRKNQGLAYTCFLILLLTLLPTSIALLIRPHSNVERTLDLVVPSGLLSILLLVRETRVIGRPSRERFSVLMRMCTPFALGFLLPIAVFLIPYAHHGALQAFFKGVFVLPFKRVWSATAAPPDIVTIIPSLCLLGLVALAARLKGRAAWIPTALVSIAAVYCFATSARNMGSYRTLWYAAYWLAPFLCAIGVVWFLRKSRDEKVRGSDLRCERLFLVLSLSAICSLIQYPFSAPIYFCYVAPLVLLAAVGVLALFKSVPKPFTAAVFLVFFFFAVFRLTPPFIYTMGFYYQADPEIHRLGLAGSGDLKVDGESVEIYGRLIPFVQNHVRRGNLYAGPDSPEVYFLSGQSNPTRAVFDFFEDDADDSNRILRLLDSTNITVVVINNRPPFSHPFAPETLHELAYRYPNRGDLGQFTVFWRD